MTNRKYLFNWLYYLLWNFSTCICPVGMEKVSTELITKAFFSTTLTNMSRYTNAKRRFVHTVLLLLWCSSSSSKNSHAATSQQKSCSWETSHFPLDMGSTNDVIGCYQGTICDGIKRLNERSLALGREIMKILKAKQVVKNIPGR